MNSYLEKLALVKQQYAVRHEVCNFNIGHLGYIAGMMKQDGLIDIVDKTILNLEPQGKLSCGQAVSIMILGMLSGSLPAGLCTIDNWVKTQPINLLLLDTLVEGNYQDINSDALCEALDRIADYGPTKFACHFIANALKESQQAITNLHFNSTAIHFHGLPQEPDLFVMSNKDEGANSLLNDESQAINQDGSHNNNLQIAQVNFLEATTILDGDVRPTMICGSALSGHEHDFEEFKDFCSLGLVELTKLYPNLKNIVLDATKANPKTLQACKDIGLDVITKLNDKMVKTDLTMLGQESTTMQTMLVPAKEPSQGECVEVKYKFLGTQELTSKDGESVTVLKCAFSAEELRSKKAKTHQNRAQKELEQLQKSIKQLQTSPKTCEAEALKAFAEISNKVKYCEISQPQLEPVYGSKGKGRPSKDALKGIVGFKVYADVAISEDKLNHHLEKDLFYIIATTDLNLINDEAGAKSLYLTYHEQSDIEGCWKDMKVTGTFIDSIFLEKESRLSALFAVLTIALLYQRRLMSIVLKVMAREAISLAPKSVKASFRTSWPTFVEYMKSEGPELSFIDRKVKVLNMLHRNSFAIHIAIEVGDEAIGFYLSDKYEDNIDLILGARRAILED